MPTDEFGDGDAKRQMLIDRLVRLGQTLAQTCRRNLAHHLINARGGQRIAPPFVVEPVPGQPVPQHAGQDHRPL